MTGPEDQPVEEEFDVEGVDVDEIAPEVAALADRFKTDDKVPVVSVEELGEDEAEGHLDARPGQFTNEED